jgi:hypothetical protein
MDSGAMVAGAPFSAHVPPDEELKYLGIVNAGDGRYYKASDAPGDARANSGSTSTP